MSLLHVFLDVEEDPGEVRDVYSDPQHATAALRLMEGLVRRRMVHCDGREFANRIAGINGVAAYAGKRKRDKGEH